MAKNTTLRIFIALVAKMELYGKMKQFDVPAAYLKTTSKERLCMAMPRGFDDKTWSIGRATNDETPAKESDYLLLLKSLQATRTPRGGHAHTRHSQQVRHRPPPTESQRHGRCIVELS